MVGGGELEAISMNKENKREEQSHPVLLGTCCLSVHHLELINTFAIRNYDPSPQKFGNCQRSGGFGERGVR